MESPGDRRFIETLEERGRALEGDDALLGETGVCVAHPLVHVALGQIVGVASLFGQGARLPVVALGGVRVTKGERGARDPIATPAFADV